jgi:vesicle-fusing ATPase
MTILLKLILLSISLEFSSCFLNNDQFSSSQKWSRIEHIVFDTASTASPVAPTSKEEAQTSLSQDVLNKIDRDSIFDIVAESAAKCLFESDKRRDAKAEHSGLVASSVTNWINDENASTLQKTIDKLKLKMAEERTGLDRDEASAWIRWMKSTPTPMVIDLSPELRVIANATMTESNFDLIQQSRTQFLSRMGVKLILLPSGSSLSRPLKEPPASLVYGKLLFGGVTRYRRLNSSNSRRPPRRTGERTTTKVSVSENIPAWIQYGGADRIYESVDIGSAAVLEITLVPRGQTLAIDETANYGDMVVQNCVWKPQEIFGMIPEEKDKNIEGTNDIDFVSGYTPISQAGKDRNDAFQADFKEDVGGLQPQIDAIVRRVLDGRVIRPVSEDDGLIEKDETTTALKVATLEAQELAILGLTPVRGLLLYGPPGTGKTLLARQIAKALRARAPKIVSAPELLDRWVG